MLPSCVPYIHLNFHCPYVKVHHWRLTSMSYKWFPSVFSYKSLFYFSPKIFEESTKMTAEPGFERFTLFSMANLVAIYSQSKNMLFSDTLFWELTLYSFKTVKFCAVAVEYGSRPLTSIGSVISWALRSNRHSVGQWYLNHFSRTFGVPWDLFREFAMSKQFSK